MLRKIEKGVVTSKGRLVIPAPLRKKYAIRKGTMVSFLEDGHRLILQPVTDEFLRSLRGSLKGKPSALDFLMKERNRDRIL
jgi:AbrB family looped-hinge helix DNA binding protein